MLEESTPESLNESVQAAPIAAAPIPAPMAELDGGSRKPAGTSASVSLDMILDVAVTLSIEVGRARMNISDLLKLTQGSIIELDRMAGEPLDVLVNGTLVARGEIVVVKDKFGIMLTEVVSPEERIRRLR